MILVQPIWLLLAIPLAALLLIAWLPPRPLLLLRGLTSLLIVLAMCQPAAKIPGKRGTVVVVADRSASMPADGLNTQEEIIRLIHSEMRTRDRLAVISFGESVAVEQPPQVGRFSGFAANVGEDQSHLAEGLDLALSLIPGNDSGRILVISDGAWTGKDPIETAVRAAGRSVPVDFRLQQRPSTDDLAIHRILAPDTVHPREGYMITAWIDSPAEQNVTYRLSRNGTVIGKGSTAMIPGLNPLTFRDIAETPRTCRYVVTVLGESKDPVPENNTAKKLVGVAGTRRVLVVTPDTASGFAELLSEGGIETEELLSERQLWTLESLADWDAIVLENVSAANIGESGMHNLVAWVEHSGKGLMMTGGKNGYGPGGYFRSPLERILPVSMELRAEHRKFSLAIVVALDRSGSMAAAAGGGKTKMDLANIGSVQVLDMLSDNDEIGVIAVDSSPHTIVDLNSVQANRGLRGKILQIDSMGGGIFVYEALSASARMLMKSKAATRHIILFADAADSEEPGQYAELIGKCRAANITVSVVGLGQPSDCDAGLLRDIALRGEGRCFFTAVPSEIPRLFAQDTFNVVRSALVDEATPVKFTGGFLGLTGSMPQDAPTIGGYNLCYIRPEANLAVVTTDEYVAPVVASWHAAAGRVLCYTGEADGELTGPIAGWAPLGSFFSSLVRWTMGKSTALPDSMMLVPELRGSDYRVDLHLDPERNEEPFQGTPMVNVLSGSPGSEPDRRTVNMRWISADTLRADVTLSGDDTVLATVDVPGVANVSLPPVCLPYSPEFVPIDRDRGRLALERLAAATGGKERSHISGIWQSMPVKTRFTDVTPWFVLAAVLVFLLEILQRRTGIFSLKRWSRPKPRPAAAAATEPVAQAPARRGKERATDRDPTKREAENATPEEGKAGKASKEESLQGAMRRARKRARERTRR